MSIQLIQNFKNILFRNLIWILPISLLVAIAYGLYTKKISPIYTSYSKIFPLTAEESSDPTSGLKAAFGISGGGSSLSKYYNVNELVKSRNLSRKIVQYPSNNPKYPRLYNWIIEDFNKSLPPFKNKLILSKDTLENIITAAQIFVGNTNIKVEKSDFTTINVNATNSELSLRLNECILDCISTFYVNTKTAKARADVIKIGALRDSLRDVMDLLLYKQADLSDKNLYAAKEIAALPQAKVERLRLEVEEAYSVSLSAYTNANFKLMSESPIFQVLDKPNNPTAYETKSWKKSFVIGFIIAFILLSIIALRKELYKIVMTELHKM
jgi:hypothetical protein